MRMLIVLVVVGALRAQTLDEKVLGAPCAVTQPSDWHALVSQQLEAVKQRQFVLAADLAKQVVRGNCANEYWWITLAESRVVADDPAGAVSALHAVFARRINEVAAKFEDPESPLKQFAQTDFFRRSEPGATLDALRQAHDTRKSAALTMLRSTPAPPSPNHVPGACPGEGCHFGPAVAKQDTVLYARPNSNQQVARVHVGERATVLTGEEILVPQPVLVLVDRPSRLSALAGTIVWLLGYGGEGEGSVWVNGKVEGAEWRVSRWCPFPDQSCWGEFLGDTTLGPGMYGQTWSTWWLRIRSATGKIGWTKGARDNFDF